MHPSPSSMPSQGHARSPSSHPATSTHQPVKSGVADPNLTVSTKRLIDAIITKTIKNPSEAKLASVDPAAKNARGHPGPGNSAASSNEAAALLTKPETDIYKHQQNLGKGSGSTPASALVVGGSTLNHLTGNRSITLGEGIDAIINQEYYSEGRQPQPSLPGPAANATRTGNGDFVVDGAWKHKAPTKRGVADGSPILVDLEPSPPASKLMRISSPAPASNYESISPPPAKANSATPPALIPHPGSARVGYAPYPSPVISSHSVPKPSENG